MLVLIGWCHRGCTPHGFQLKSTAEQQLMRSLPQKWKAKRQKRGMKRE